MSLVGLITALGSVSELEQVVSADSGELTTSVDSGAEIYSLLNGLVGQRVYPLTLDDNTDKPSIVYQLIGTQFGDVDGRMLTQTDQYELTVRDDDFDDLVTLVNSVNTQIGTSTYAIQVESLLFDYDEKQECFKAEMLLSFTYLALPSQDKPAALVWLRERTGGAIQDAHKATQRIDNEYGIALMTTGDMAALRDAVMAGLLGKEVNGGGHDMRYLSGQHLGKTGNLTVWQEIYTDWMKVTET